MRKARLSDTTTGAISMLRSAREAPLPPPAELSESAHRFWYAIVGDRPAGDWSDTDLFIAARAASAMADVIELQAILDREGSIITTRTGPKVHPGVGVLDLCTKRLLSLRRAIGMGVDNSRDARRRSEAYRRSRLIAGELANEPLLAQ